MKKMHVTFSGHGIPMIALAHNDLTAAFNHIGQEVIPDWESQRPS